MHTYHYGRVDFRVERGRESACLVATDGRQVFNLPNGKYTWARNVPGFGVRRASNRLSDKEIVRQILGDADVVFDE